MHSFDRYHSWVNVSWVGIILLNRTKDVRVLPIWNNTWYCRSIKQYKSYVFCRRGIEMNYSKVLNPQLVSVLSSFHGDCRCYGAKWMPVLGNWQKNIMFTPIHPNPIKRCGMARNPPNRFVKIEDSYLWNRRAVWYAYFTLMGQSFDRV